MMRAIELNGIELEKNKQAFGWGRIAAADAERCNRLIADSASAARAENLDEVIRRRADFLVDYQDQALADRYVALIERVRESGNNEPLTEAVARAYFKLLSYKDEYEVARLYTQTGFLDKLREESGDKASVRFHMAPPLLGGKKDSRGRPRKKEFAGTWMTPVLRLLARMRFLRGSKLDIFGLTADRRLERQLITEFEHTIDRLLPILSKETVEQATEVIDLYQDIRGYGPVKEQAAEEVRGKIAAHAIMRA